MADLDSKRHLRRNVPDDAPFLSQAMAMFGFLCDFSQLNLGQQQLALSLAEHFKRDHKSEVYES